MSLSAASLYRAPLQQALRYNRCLLKRPRPCAPLRKRCYIVRAYGNKDKEQFLKGISPANRDEVAQILDQAQRAESTWTSIFTDFYTPPIISDATQVLKPLSDIRAERWGGYDMAERTRLRLSRADMPEDEAGLVGFLCDLQRQFVRAHVSCIILPSCAKLARISAKYWSSCVSMHPLSGQHAAFSRS